MSGSIPSMQAFSFVDIGAISVVVVSILVKLTFEKNRDSGDSIVWSYVSVYFDAGALSLITADPLQLINYSRERSKTAGRSLLVSSRQLVREGFAKTNGNWNQINQNIRLQTLMDYASKFLDFDIQNDKGV